MAVVLVVEEDPSVREGVVEALAEAGHTIMEAANGEEAMTLLRQHPEIELLFTDIHMPGAINGVALAKIGQRMRPDLRVLYATSHVLELLRDRGPIDPEQIVRKPYLPGQVVAAAEWLLRQSI